MMYRLIIIAVGLAILAGCAIEPVLDESPSLVSADKLKKSVVTADLEYAIAEGSNLIWCATEQIAWNKLNELAGVPLQAEGQVPMIQALNKKLVTTSDLDEDTYVTVAGFGDEVIEKAEADLKKKFGKNCSPELLPSRGDYPDTAFISYAYLFVDLSFKWAFERHERKVLFGDEDVATFGIYQYLPEEKNEKRAAKQVLIYDYKNKDDFIIELCTRNQAHQLLLAKVPPDETLLATVTGVLERVANGTTSKMPEARDLIIPIVDFDVLRRYHELDGVRLKSDNKRFDGSPVESLQQIRFRLDEKGAILKSQAMVAGCDVSDNLVFNRPFLALLKTKTAKMPYLAIWIDNAELLLPFKPTGSGEISEPLME